MDPDPARAARRPTASRMIRAAPLLLAALALACGGGDEETAAGAGGSPVEAAVARTDTLSLEVRAVGSLEAEARIEVRPEIDGHVTSVHFREGDRVDRGQVLLRLDQNKLQAEREAARATVLRNRTEVENLERRVTRNDSLLAQGAISEQAFDDLQTQLNTARARLEEARANLNLAEQHLDDATITAPFAGRTGARSFDLGDYVRVGDPLFTLVDDQPLEIAFPVPERYLGQLHLGSPLSLTVRSSPGRSFRGEVDFVSPFVDEQSRTVKLKARIPNPGSELRPGQFADVRLQLESRPAVIVPEATVVTRQGGSVAFLVREGRAVRREVEVGARRRGVVEILSGVSAGDTVVVAGHQRLQDGAEVRATVEMPTTLPGQAVGGETAAGRASGSGAAERDSADDGPGGEAAAGSGSGASASDSDGEG